MRVSLGTSELNMCLVALERLYIRTEILLDVSAYLNIQCANTNKLRFRNRHVYHEGAFREVQTS
jgi:hypothetical protein